MDFLELIESNQTIISGISSISQVILVFFTLIFTIIYVKATVKLVHIPYKAYVKIKRIDEKMNLIISNLGPGIAFSIKVLYCSSRRLARITDKKKKLFWYKYKVSDILGELVEKSDSCISRLDSPNLSYLFLLKWATQTGKNYSKYFKYIGGLYGFREATKLEIMNYKVFRIKEYIKQPITKLKIRSYMEVDKAIMLIIGILAEKGDLAVDFIADEFDSRNDDEIAMIIDMMIKKNLVVRNGFDIALTEKGICYNSNEVHIDEVGGVDKEKSD